MTCRPRARAGPPEHVARAGRFDVGDKVWFHLGGKRSWTIRARSDRYLILTKPFNLKRTVLYTIVDLELGIRGAVDHWGCGFESEEEIVDSLARLSSGEAAVSTRNSVPLSIVRDEVAGLPSERVGVAV